MTMNLLILSGAVACLVFGNGCSTVSKVASHFPRGMESSVKTNNPEQMRIATEAAVFQPVVRVDFPQFAGLQTPLAGGRRQRSNSDEKPVSLPQFTPVKVLSNNGRYAMVQIKTGERGFVPAACIATESAIMAAAKPAEPAHNIGAGIDPASGLPYGSQALYVPSMDASDAPVDEAMLNNIDSIPLPESEMKGPETPEASDVDGVVLRSTNLPATP